MTSGFTSGEFLRGLTVRVLFFLSLALLPIGIIAISQTQQIAKQNRMNAELSLLAITEQAATAEARILQRAFGATDALASVVRLYRDDPEHCSALLRAYKTDDTIYSLVGFIRLDGLMECASIETPYDFSEEPGFNTQVERPRPRAKRIEQGDQSIQSDIIVTTPVFEEGELDGFVAVIVPIEKFRSEEEPELASSPLALVTFNKSGDLLTTERGLEKANEELPKDVSLTVFAEGEARVFEALNQAGERRVYAFRPIVRGAAFAVSVWPTETPILSPSILTRLSTLLPIVMWAASLLVAFWALNRLAIRHIGKLDRQMRRFALNRDMPRKKLGPGVPTELVQIENTFIRMGESILRDEATLEDSLREKNILLKEVHHRVKNNLQLISSIMNMQIRQAKTEDSKKVLERLQERILSLATVHKNLYQNDDLVRVHAPTLLREAVNQLLSVVRDPASKVKVEQSYADINLDADDAAPLTLLVSEALTNALKHVSQDPANPSWLSITLSPKGDREATLEVANSKGKTPTDPGTGLGFKLINAFCRQLNGHFEVDDTEERYVLTMTFPVAQGPKPRKDF